jgi:hypothetical protein
MPEGVYGSNGVQLFVFVPGNAVNQPLYVVYCFFPKLRFCHAYSPFSILNLRFTNLFLRKAAALR